MRARPGRLGLVATAAASTLAGAATVEASHRPSASYTGSTAEGGSVSLDVSTDGSEITRLTVNLGMTDCGFIALNTTGVGFAPIVDHAYAYTGSGWTVNGSFHAANRVRGSLAYRSEGLPACALPARDWTAKIPGTPLAIALSGRRTQRAGRTVAVSVRSDEAATARATGRATVGGSGGGATRYALRSAVAQLTPNVGARLRLRVPKRARAAISDALGAGRSVRAIVTVVVTDGAGNTARDRRTITLRR